MEFRILGPLDVERGDRPLRLGARRERTLLALLLLQPNVTVSIDFLVDQLWPVTPPPSAVHAVHVAVSRLRQLLDEETPRIITQRPGYRLRVEPGELDAETFEQLLTAADASWEANDAATTARLLRDALNLWRGSPLADLADEPFVTQVAARLDELRLRALERRIEADLALGNGSGVVGELEDLCATHPMREGLHALLMQALAASGRRSDALRVYRETRALLVEELGVEPGPALREIHQQILAVPEEPLAPATDVAVPALDERKVVSVLCVECALAPSVLDDPERMRAVHDDFVDAIRDAVARTGGVVDETAGPMVVASFGADTAVQDHAQRALVTAAEICDVVPDVNQGIAWIRVGVSSGEVVIGTDRMGRRTVSGPVVVEAARLQQGAQPGTVAVADRTKRLARAPGGDRAGHAHAFVGRAEQLRLLHDCWRHTVDRQRPHVVTVVGEAGIGKTSLVAEFVTELGTLAPPQGPTIRTGRCLAYGTGITFWPLGEVLRAHLGVPLNAASEVVQERLGERQILGLTLGLDVAPDLHPVVAQQRLHAAWVRLAHEMAGEGTGVVWVVEDVHWAEPPLLELIEQVVQEAKVPLLVICTGRPESIGLRPGGIGGSRGSILGLEPLSPDEADALAALVLDAPQPEWLRPVLRQAEGNPFFIEELIASLIDARLLVRQGQMWEVRGSLDRVSIPDTVRGALASRVDRLPTVDRVSLQAAAVAGREFSRAAVAELVPGATADYERLMNRGFLVAATGHHEGAQLMFKHALTRDVVYDGIAHADRADLHGRFADWLDSRGNSEEYAALLAHHYQNAVQPPELVARDPARATRNAVVTGRAVTWLQRSGEQAISRHAIDEGLALLTRALELEEDPERQAQLWHAVGRGHAVRYDGMSCWHALARAIELTEDPAERAAIHAELAMQTVVRYAMLNPMPSRELVDSWIEQALDTAPAGSLARAQALAAHAMWFAPDPTAAAQEAYSAAVEVDDVNVLDHAYNALALAAFTEGRYEDSKEWARRRLDLLDAVNDPDVAVDILSAMIPALLGQGAFDEAMHYAAQHDEAASRLSAHHRVHAVAMRLEVHELAAGWQEMAELGSRTREAVADNQATPCVRNSRSLLSVAVGLQCLGQRRSALDFEMAADDVIMTGYEGSLAPLRLILALHRDDLGEVEQLLPLAVPPPPAKNSWRLITHATRLDALAQLGAAEQLRAEALPLLVPRTYLGAFAQRALALLDRDAAALQRAADSFCEMGLDWHVRQTLAAGVTGRLQW
jgi:DNA-binding SARP family transcriptional activator/tetratricopeptide (TPR) repeat protein